MTTVADAHPPRLVLRGVVIRRSDPIDLRVAAGEVVAVSGGGGSELLWVLAGWRPPESGEIAVDGTVLQDHQQAGRAGVALVPRGNGLASLLTAFENVLLPVAAPRTGPGDSGDEPAVTARRALEAVGLAESGDHLIEELSGGQQQRVAIARAIALRPRLLLADQATTDLDAANRARVVALLRELAADGTAVLMASDDPAIVSACDWAVTLELGADHGPA